MIRMMLSGVFVAGLSLAGGGAAGAVAAEGVPGAARGDRLVVTVDDGAGQVATYVLECHPTGGTHPDAEGACGRLDELGGPVGPAGEGQLCTMLYGGPQKATVTGSWLGAPVDARYNRTNGCEAARWKEMAPVLPLPRRKDVEGAESEPG